MTKHTFVAFRDWWSLPATMAGVFFVDKLFIPDGTPEWVTPALYVTAMVSNVAGNLTGQARARKDAEKLKEEASDLGTALAVERERVDRLEKDLDKQRSLRNSDKTIADGRLDSMRKAHKEEMDALMERHREEEQALRLSHQVTETYLRKTIEKKDSLRDANNDISHHRIEELLVENGNLKADLERWKAMYTAEQSVRFEISREHALHGEGVAE